jgi:phage shock protein A
MQRLINWFKAIFNKFMNQVEDPEIMLDQAKREMQEALVQNRERAIEAIAAKNRLEDNVKQLEDNMRNCEMKAEQALKQNKRDLALQFISEKQRYAANLGAMKESLAQAETTIEQVKTAIKRQETDVRNKAAEALALKTQWKSAQIQTSITKALEGLSFENELEGFGAASSKIKDAQSEALARQEMFGDSVAGKIMQLEDASNNSNAEQELLELEQRLAGVSTEIAPDLEQELSDLESKIQETQAKN